MLLGKLWPPPMNSVSPCTTRSPPPAHPLSNPVSTRLCIQSSVPRPSLCPHVHSLIRVPTRLLILHPSSIPYPSCVHLLIRLPIHLSIHTSIYSSPIHSSVRHPPHIHVFIRVPIHPLLLHPFLRPSHAHLSFHSASSGPTRSSPSVPPSSPAIPAFSRPPPRSPSVLLSSPPPVHPQLEQCSLALW